MKCPRCHSNTVRNDLFCGQCGEKLAQVCPRCGTCNSSLYTFCGNCGHGLVLEPLAVGKSTGPVPWAQGDAMAYPVISAGIESHAQPTDGSFPSDTVIEFNNVVKTYQVGIEKVFALNNVTFSIQQGEFISIVGPSGSGKTTLLNMIGCVDLPTSGMVNIDHIQTSTLKEKELARIRSEKIGFVFQQFFLLPTLTAIENVLLPAIFSADEESHQGKRTRANHLLDLVGLSGRADHLPSQLSGGEMQRVAIARALINNPKIIIADEPTGNLDSKNAEASFGIFRKLHGEGMTIIIVTHTAELANRAERVIHLKDGAISEQPL